MSLSERERLQILAQYRVLDTPAEESFDALTRLAAITCKVPISLVSLVDRDRQWFKSRVGLEAAETPRELAFCAHAIRADELFIVPDASADDRFATNPLVIEEPRIRFYAGAPLTMSSGARLGTLCVIDRVPRKLCSDQLEALSTLRHAVVQGLELRRSRRELQIASHLIPMCAWCNSVQIEREGEVEWQPLSCYVSENLPITHAICRRCSGEL